MARMWQVLFIVLTALHTTTGAPVGVLDTRGAARWLGVSTKTIERMRDRGELPYSRIGPRLVRFDPADLQRYVDERKGVEAVSR